MGGLGWENGKGCSSVGPNWTDSIIHTKLTLSEPPSSKHASNLSKIWVQMVQIFVSKEIDVQEWAKREHFFFALFIL